MPKRTKLADFSDQPVVLPDFAPGDFGMDRTLRKSMTDEEWARWIQLTKVTEMKRFMSQYRRDNGIKGLREAVFKFLNENNIEAIYA